VNDFAEACVRLISTEGVSSSLFTFGRRRKRKLKVEAEKSFQCSVFSFQGRGERWRRRRES
jgi:hypothetical protein